MGTYIIITVLEVAALIGVVWAFIDKIDKIECDIDRIKLFLHSMTDEQDSFMLFADACRKMVQTGDVLHKYDDTTRTVATQEQKEAYQKRKWMIDAYINKYRKDHFCPMIYGSQDPFVLHDHIAECFVMRIAGYFALAWNPYDVTDPCNSIEEKREEYCKQAAADMRYYRKMPRYAIEYAVFIGLDGRKDKLFGQTNGKDKYSYTMPDEPWDKVKEIIKWDGKEPATESMNG